VGDSPHTFVSRTVASTQEHPMSKRARKRRTRKKSGANHGNRPNA
jgi:hypothetical protein